MGSGPRHVPLPVTPGAWRQYHLHTQSVLCRTADRLSSLVVLRLWETWPAGTAADCVTGLCLSIYRYVCLSCCVCGHVFVGVCIFSVNMNLKAFWLWLFCICSQVLLSQVHRQRALELLGRFLDLGPWAVNLVGWLLTWLLLPIHLFSGIYNGISYHITIFSNTSNH